jgi:hypothetical protein
VAHVRIDISEEGIASNKRVKRLREQGTTLAVTSNVVSILLISFPLMMEAALFSEKSVLTTVTQRHIPENDIHHRHRREYLKSCNKEPSSKYK